MLGINIRVTEQEKKRILRNAKRCGLSSSEYLRQLGSGHSPQAIPTPEIRDACRMLSELVEDYAANYDDNEFQSYLKYALGELLAFCNSTGGMSDRNDKNMAGARQPQATCRLRRQS